MRKIPNPILVFLAGLYAGLRPDPEVVRKVTRRLLRAALVRFAAAIQTQKR
jgi:hypothetical protein